LPTFFYPVGKKNGWVPARVKLGRIKNSTIVDVGFPAAASQDGIHYTAAEDFRFSDRAAETTDRSHEVSAERSRHSTEGHPDI